MKYFYEPPEKWNRVGWRQVCCNHEMFNRCTLYLKNGLGIMVVQKHFNETTKASWWGCVDPPIAHDIYNHERFASYFERYATPPDRSGLYRVIQLRKLMWALRMKPLKKEFWEDDSF